MNCVKNHYPSIVRPKERKWERKRRRKKKRERIRNPGNELVEFSVLLFCDSSFGDRPQRLRERRGG